MSGILEFEKPIYELRKKLEELKHLMRNSKIELSSEIEELEKRLLKLEEEIYENLSPWDRVQIARHPSRPTFLDYVPHLFQDFFEVHGDRLYGDDEAIVAGIASYHGVPVTVIGQQRGRDTKENVRRNFGMPHPEGYRKALRLMEQAEKFGRPIITFIDTKGAYPGKAAEERGQSEAIARNLFHMAGLKVPTISIVIGEGGSGGALALGVTNSILMLENSTYSVISPEGAAAILWKDSNRSRQAAEALKITASDLKSNKVIDVIVPEVKGGAHYDVECQAKNIDAALSKELQKFKFLSKDDITYHRINKFMKMGSFIKIDDKMLSEVRF